MAEAPARIRQAIALLWLALVISVADWTLTLVAIETEERTFFASMAFGLATFFALNALLIHLASRRRNWARIALLLLTLALLSSYGIWPPDIAVDTLSEWFPSGIASLLEVAAMAMLFSGKGALWYEPSKSAAQGG